MKKLSIAMFMMLCAALMQAQASQQFQPVKDTIRGTETQTININQGWSGISTYLDPSDPAIEVLIAAIQDQLLIIMDFDGNFYQPPAKSVLDSWDFIKGYFIKMASAETLEITGLYPLTQQLDLQAGWNLIPVLDNTDISIEDYFAENLDEIEIIKEVAGIGIYWSDMDIFTLTELIPGKAYLVKVNTPFTLFELPEVATAPITDITGHSAVSGGEVISEGSSPVTVRGVVWSELENPTVEMNEGMTFDGTGSGIFVSEVSGLSSETTYFIRAYATSDEGTAYGGQEVFTSGGLDFNCGDLLVDARDGKAYQTTQIGTQCWMAENLNVGTFISGDYGFDQTNNGVIEKYCYNNNPFYCDDYGGLYQWDEMMDYTLEPGVQGICPEGWHVPTEAEFLQLRSYVADVSQGKIIKSCRQVDSPLGGDCSTTEHPRWDNDGTHYGTDDFGFSALPGGNRYMYGGFYNLGTQAYWWTSNEGSSIYHALYYGVTYNQDGLPSNSVNWYKTDGYSVRCLQEVPL